MRQKELFLVLDLGGHSLKASLFELDQRSRKARILRSQEKEHSFGDLRSEDREAVEKLAAAIMRVPAATKLIIGTGSEFIQASSFRDVYLRKTPAEQIDSSELQNIIQSAQRNAFEKIRKQFSLETGRAEIDAALLNSFLQEIRMDDYPVQDLLGLRGREVILSIFNTYMPRIYFSHFETLAQHLRAQSPVVLYEPYAVYRAFIQAFPSESEAILLDIGGKLTRVSIVRKGNLESVRSFPLGAGIFSNRIAREFGVGPREAEQIKISYDRGDFGDFASQKIARILEPEDYIFLNSLTAVLQDVAQAHLLPGNIFLHGGGSNLILFQRLLGKKKWRDKLSFLHPPKTQILNIDFSFVQALDKVKNPAWINSLALAETYVQDMFNKDNFLQKTLRRTVKLLQ